MWWLHFLYSWIKFSCVCTLHLHCRFIYCWTSRRVPFPTIVSGEPFTWQCVDAHGRNRNPWVGHVVFPFQTFWETSALICGPTLFLFYSRRVSRLLTICSQGGSSLSSCSPIGHSFQEMLRPTSVVYYFPSHFSIWPMWGVRLAVTSFICRLRMKRVVFSSGFTRVSIFVEI